MCERLQLKQACLVVKRFRAHTNSEPLRSNKVTLSSVLPVSRKISACKATFWSKLLHWTDLMHMWQRIANSVAIKPNPLNLCLFPLASFKRGPNSSKVSDFTMQDRRLLGFLHICPRRILTLNHSGSYRLNLLRQDRLSQPRLVGKAERFICKWYWCLSWTDKTAQIRRL